MIRLFLLLAVVCSLFSQGIDETPPSDSPTQESLEPAPERPDVFIEEIEREKIDEPPMIYIPSERDTLFKQGEKYLQEKNYEAAQRIFERLVMINEKDVAARIKLGYALFYQQKYSEAEKQWKLAITYDPESKEAYLALYELYLQVGENEKADESLSKSKEITIQEPFVPPQEEKEIVIEKPAVIALSERDMLYQQGEKYLEEKNYQGAQEVFEDLLSADKQDVDARVKLGYVLFYQNKYQEAEKQWKIALKQAPNYSDAYLGLYKLYHRMGQMEKADEYLQKAKYTSSDSYDVNVIFANESLRSYQYKDAYQSFKILYQNNRNYDFFTKLVYLRPLVYPSIESKTSYSRETEQDLVTNLKTVRLFNWFQSVLFTLPVKEVLSFYGTFNYNLTNQYNLLRSIHNYKVNIYTYGGGIKFNYHDRWIANVNLHEKKGESASEDVFPFQNKKLFEPGVSIRYVDTYNFLNLAGYYDSFVARNFTNIVAFFVKRKTFVPTYEIRIKAPYTAIGFDGLLSYYRGFINNRRRGAGLWIRTALPQFKDHLLLRYRGFYSTFDEIDPDYFSYRKRWEHYFTTTLQSLKEAVYLLQINFTFSWQEIRDFTNIAEGIETSVNPPQVLQRNIFQGYEIEALIRRWAKTNFFVETSFKYYIDTNEYETYSTYLQLRYVF